MLDQLHRQQDQTLVHRAGKRLITDIQKLGQLAVTGLR